MEERDSELSTTDELSPNETEHQKLRARAQEALDYGDYYEAINIYLELLNELDPPDAELLNKLGIAYARSGKLENAEEAFRAALEQDETYAPALSNLGNIHYSREEYEEAEALYKEAIKYDPDYGTAYNNLAAAYKKQGKIAEAVDALKKSQRLQVKNPPSLPGRSADGGRRRRGLGCLGGSGLVLMAVFALVAVLLAL